MDIAENISIGLSKLDLVSEINKEGRTWRFYGIQSKKNKEWVLRLNVKQEAHDRLISVTSTRTETQG